MVAARQPHFVQCHYVWVCAANEIWKNIHLDWLKLRMFSIGFSTDFKVCLGFSPNQEARGSRRLFWSDNDCSGTEISVFYNSGLPTNQIEFSHYEPKTE